MAVAAAAVVVAWNSALGVQCRPRRVAATVDPSDWVDVEMKLLRNEALRDGCGQAFTQWAGDASTGSGVL